MICCQAMVLSRRLPSIKSLFNHVSKMQPSQFSRQLLLGTANLSLECTKENDDLVKPNSSIVITKKAEFLGPLTHAIQQRDLKEAQKRFFRSPLLCFYDDAKMLNELLKWMEESPTKALKLLEIFMHTLAHNHYQLYIYFFENFIQKFNKISHLPSFEKVEVGNDRKCVNCSSYFVPKPTFTDEGFAAFSRVLYEYAKEKKVPSKEFETLQSCATILLKWKKENSSSSPICLADVNNIIHGEVEGTNRLTDLPYLPLFLDEMLPNFSAVGLISKFDLPDDTIKELEGLKRVVYYKTYNENYSHNLILFLMFTECGKDTYIVTNDRFRDDMFNLIKMKCPLSLTPIYGILRSRCLKFSKSTGVLEKPCEISPFVHKTSTGYHLAIRRSLDKNGTAYDYYCCNKLF